MAKVSRYPSRASAKFLRASSSVFPCEIHPGSSSDCATKKPPSSRQILAVNAISRERVRPPITVPRGTTLSQRGVVFQSRLVNDHRFQSVACTTNFRPGVGSPENAVLPTVRSAMGRSTSGFQSLPARAGSGPTRREASKVFPPRPCGREAPRVWCVCPSVPNLQPLLPCGSALPLAGCSGAGAPCAERARSHRRGTRSAVCRGHRSGKQVGVGAPPPIEMGGLRAERVLWYVFSFPGSLTG